MSLEILSDGSSIVKNFSKYSVIDTGKTNEEGKAIFWVLKKDEKGDHIGYVSKPKNTFKPFDFVDSVFSVNYIAVRSGYLTNERNEIIKRTFLIISTEHWSQVILAKLAENELYKCTEPFLNENGEIEVKLLLPEEVKLKIS